MNYYIDMIQKQDIFTVISGRVKFSRCEYNLTSDAVWLAAAVKSAKTVLDVGIGTGGISLCLLSHNPNLKITGIDKSEKMLSLCKQNAELNNQQIELINTDITNWKTDKTFDAVVTNPPYFKGSPAKHDAHHNADLGIWTEKCLARVKPMGYFYTIIDAGVMDKIIAKLKPRCGDITIIPLFGNKNTAERVIITARLNSRSKTRLFSGLPMNYDKVLRDGLTIDKILTTLYRKCLTL